MGTFCLTWFLILFFSKLGLWDMVICTPILPTFLSSGGAYCFFLHGVYVPGRFIIPTNMFLSCKYLTQLDMTGIIYLF